MESLSRQGIVHFRNTRSAIFWSYITKECLLRNFSIGSFVTVVSKKIMDMIYWHEIHQFCDNYRLIFFEMAAKINLVKSNAHKSAPSRIITATRHKSLP